MRNHLVILMIVFCMTIHTVFADEVLLGTVRSADPAKGEMVVEIIDGLWSWNSESDNPSDDPSDDSSDDPAERITVRMNPGEMPKSLRPGLVIRVWGNYRKSAPDIFQADSIRGRGLPPPGSLPGMQPHPADPTGVRSRLGRRPPGRPPAPPKGSRP